jgi:glycosyltransferase involved in cell wall biosynthesis
MFILGSLAGGGAERMVADLVRYINRDEFDAKIGLLSRSGPYLPLIDADDLVVPARMQGWVAYRDRPSIARLLPSLAIVPLQQREILRRFRPHIVVTATKSMNLAARVSLALAGRNRFGWIVREGNNTGAMIDSEMGRLGRRLQNAAVRASYRSADVIVAISNGVAGELATRFGLDRASIRTVFNAVDLARVSRAVESWTAPRRERPIVAAGRLDDQKGFDVLLRAYAAGRARHVAPLVILGEGPRRPDLEALARDLGVSERVELPGFVDSPWGLFANARLFVCSSRWEGFGNVIIEAMACGAPVVSTDCNFGPREILSHDKTGWLVPVDDVEALRAGIDALLEDSGLAQRLAAAARLRARDFDVSQMVRSYEQLFREIAPRASAKMVS